MNLVPKCETKVRARSNSIPTFNCRTDCFKYSFFPSSVSDCFNLDLNIRISESVSILKSRFLKLGLSHLNKHRFRYSFQNCLNLFCSCSLETEDTSHYPLHCHHFSHHRVVFMNSVKSICDNFDSLPDKVKEGLLLYGDSRFDENKNRVILKATISYMKNTERFSGSLFD